MVNETIKYEYEENNDVYVVEIQETGVERSVDGITVRETFEIFEDLVNDWTDEMMEDIELIREITDVLCALIRVKEYEVKLALMVYGVLPITPKTNLKGDNMEWTVLDEQTIEEMSLKEFEMCGTITETNKEDVEFEFKDLKGVFFKIIELGFDLTKTDAFKECKEEWFNSDVDDEDIFLDVFFEKLFYEDIVFKENKNIIIENSVIECSFDYDYGSISSTHTEWGTVGYNVFVEDIE